MTIFRTGAVSAFLLLLLSAGSFAADEAQRIAEEHADDKPVASPLAEQQPAVRVDSRRVIYTSSGDTKVEGWLAWPAGQPTGSLPGLIVIHEWWGLNDNIRATSERLAAEGYVTLAVDLYNGQTAEVPKQAMQQMMLLNEREEEGRENIVAAYEYLASIMEADKIGIVGWCLGGRWSLQGALSMPEQLDAMVMYYGGVVTDKQSLATLEMPILGHFAETDPIVPPDTVIVFRDELEELDKDAQVYIYPGTKHAFSNPSGLAYNKDAADLAWSRTVEFFGAHLQ